MAWGGIAKGDKASTPVVYLISDGEETCGGDPVAAAKALNGSGVNAIVNVIGFDVDAETRAQLEAISEAGGGKYFAAKDSAALAKHLQAASDTVNSRARYDLCLDRNQALAQAAYKDTINNLPACFVREGQRNIQDVILKQVKAFTAEADLACAYKVERMARREWHETSAKMSKLYRGLNDESQAAGLAARERAAKDALPPQ